MDAAGNVYIAETQNAAIRKVSAATGNISVLVENACGTYYANGAFMPQVLYGPTGLFLDGKGDLYVADTLDMLVREMQGNFVAIHLSTPVFQGQTSPTHPKPWRTTAMPRSISRRHYREQPILFRRRNRHLCHQLLLTTARP